MRSNPAAFIRAFTPALTVGNPRQDMADGVPFRLVDYLELIDCTGRRSIEGKWGSIDDGLPGILQRLDIDGERWLYMTQNYESGFKTMQGAQAARISGVCRLEGNEAQIDDC